MARFRRRDDQWVVPLARLPDDAGPEVGRVARAMLTARWMGLPVPVAEVVLAPAFGMLERAVLPPGHDVASLLRVIHRPRGVERAALARERLLGAAVSDRLRRELGMALERLEPGSLHGIRLIASPQLSRWEDALAADLYAQHSIPKGRPALLEGLKHLWSRTFAEHTLGALRERRIRDAAIGVVLIPAQHASLLGWALPEGRAVRPEATGGAEGIEPASHAVFLRDSRGDPAGCFRLGADGSIASRFGALAEMPNALIPKLLEALHVVGSSGRWALEFAVGDDGAFSVIDLWRLPDAAPVSARWARTTLGAAQPWGRATALSLEFCAAAAEARVRRGRLAAGRPLSRSERPVAVVRGRCFVDASLLDLPSSGSEVPRAALHQLGGAQLEVERALSPPEEPVGLARGTLMAARLGAEVRRLGDVVERFEREAEQQRRWLGELDLGILPDDALKTTLREGREFFARCVRLTGDVAAALALGEATLSGLVSRVAKGRAPSVVMGLVSGLGNLETVKPALAFAHVVEIARRDPKASEALGGRSTVDPARGPAARSMHRFLDAFGDLVDGDAELSRPRWREDPGPLFDVLRVALSGPPLDVAALSSVPRSEALRVRADVEAQLPFVERRLGRELVQRLEELVRLGCRLRVRVAHACSMLRIIGLDVDARLCRLDPSFVASGAFDCRFDELVDAVGDARVDLAPVVQWRQAARSGSRGQGDVLAFQGVPLPWEPLPAEEAVIRAIGVAPGVARGRGHFVGRRIPKEFMCGDIAIVESADLGHGPLMLVAGGIISEIGNPWSDGAILARELGVPMVSGVGSTHALLSRRQRLKVDGSRGRIEREPSQ